RILTHLHQVLNFKTSSGRRSFRTMLKQQLENAFTLLRVTTLALVFGIIATCLCPAQSLAASRKSRNSSAPQDVPDQVNSLMRQLYGVQLIDAGKIPAQAQDLVLHALTAWMTGGGLQMESGNYAVDVRVRMQLERYFSKLHYPFFGAPVVFARPWNGGEIIGAGFTLGWSDFDRVNTFALYETKGGTTRQVAVGNFFPGPDMHYALLPPSPSGAFRFIVYGNRLGKSQPRLSVALYSFDGQKLDDLWRQQDLYAGKINVTSETITLRYLIESEYVQAVQQGQWPDWHEAVYRVTPNGVALETERLAPYKGAS
ncbi:MAG: hypothetical protein ACRD2G_16915, partial [Terriglobia bacterium]